jgi:hypothetical protein
MRFPDPLREETATYYRLPGTSILLGMTDILGESSSALLQSPCTYVGERSSVERQQNALRLEGVKVLLVSTAKIQLSVQMIDLVVVDHSDLGEHGH